MKEELRLVREWAELRVGMIVVCVGVRCKKQHRGILIAGTKCPQGAAAFSMAPSITDCCRVSLQTFACAVHDRNVYRVVDGLEASSQTEKTKRRRGQRERAR